MRPVTPQTNRSLKVGIHPDVLYSSTKRHVSAHCIFRAMRHLLGATLSILTLHRHAPARCMCRAMRHQLGTIILLNRLQLLRIARQPVQIRARLRSWGGGGGQTADGGGGGICVSGHTAPTPGPFQACNTGCNTTAAAAAASPARDAGVLTATKTYNISELVFLLLCYALFVSEKTV